MDSTENSIRILQGFCGDSMGNYIGIGNSLGNLKGIYQELFEDSMGLCRNFCRDFIMNSTEVLEGS